MQAFLDYLAMNWVGLLVALIVGYLLAWLIVGRPAGRKSNESAKQASNLEAELTTSSRTLDTTSHELQAAKQQIANSQTEVDELQATLQQKGTEIEGLQTTLQQKGTEIEGLQATLQQKDEELADALSKLAGPVRLFEKVAGVSPAAVSLDHLTAAKAPAIIATILGGMKTKLVPEVQDMVALPGIGKAMEQKLYGAGIGTYWELANLTDEEMVNILQPTAVQHTSLDLAKVRTTALNLAQQTESVGAIWNAHHVDDLEAIPGISGVFEQPLYNAGISTYQDLAISSIEQLSEICRPPSTMMPNYAAWIAKAGELAQQGNGTSSMTSSVRSGA